MTACPYCGVELADSPDECTNCGQDITAFKTKPTSGKKRGSRKRKKKKEGHTDFFFKAAIAMFITGMLLPFVIIVIGQGVTDNMAKIIGMAFLSYVGFVGLGFLLLKANTFVSGRYWEKKIKLEGTASPDEMMQLMDRAYELMDIFFLEDPVRTTGEAVGDVVSHLLHDMAREYEDKVMGKGYDNPMEFVGRAVEAMKELSLEERAKMNIEEIRSRYREIFSDIVNDS